MFCNEMSKNRLFDKMLISLVILLAIFPKPLSSSNNVVSVQYPYVAPSPSVGHGRKYGMQQKECFVARLCEYKIDKEKFSCKISEYVISKGSERTMPKWLWFDEGNHTLKGIPSPADEGLSEILVLGLGRQPDSLAGSRICGSVTVKIVVWSLKYFPLFASNFPTSPEDNDKFSRTSAWQSTTCEFNEPIVLAALVLTGNFHEMDGKQKINLLDELLQIYHIPMSDVFLLPSSEDDPLSGFFHTSNVLASGAGANRSATGARTTISWHVTCGVIRLDDSLFQVMENFSQQKVFIHNVSYAPIGWYVITGFQKHHVRRRRNIILGTTTPAYSTIPISRATVITTKIKRNRTTYISPTATFTLVRPFPTFSSPFAANMTSAYSNSSRVTIQLTNKTIVSPYESVNSTIARPLSQTLPSRQQTSEISQDKIVSSTLSLTSLSRNASSVSQIPLPTLDISMYESVSSTKSVISESRLSVSQPILISPSRQQPSETSQYSSTVSAVLQSTNVSSLPQISPSSQQASVISKNKTSTNISQIRTTSEITRSANMSSIPQLSSTRLASTLFQPLPSLTASNKQSSTLRLLPSSKNVLFTSSVQPTAQSVVRNTSFSQIMVNSSSHIPSLVVTSLFSTISRLFNTTTTKPTIPLNYSTPIRLQPSYSNVINALSSTIMSLPTFTASGIINGTKSTQVSQTSHLSFSSTTGMKSVTSFMVTPVTHVALTTPGLYTSKPSYSVYTATTRSNLTATLIPVGTYSSIDSTSSKKVNITPTRNDPSSIISKSDSTGTLMMRTMSWKTRTVEVNQTARSEMSMSTPEAVSKILQSPEFTTSKVFKASTTVSHTTNSSRLGSAESSGSRSEATTTFIIKPTSTFAGDTFLVTVTSQPGSKVTSSMSSLSSAAMISTSAMESTLSEQLGSTYSSVMKTSPVLTYNTSAKSKTIQSGSLISTVVPSPSTSFFTPRVSAVPSSSVARSYLGHRSLSSSSTLSNSFSLSGSTELFGLQSQTTSSSSPLIAPISSQRGSTHIATSNRIFDSSATPVTFTPSLPSYHTPTHHSSSSLSSVVIITASSLVHPSYHTPSSPTLAGTTSISSHSPLYYQKSTTPSPVVITTRSPNFFPSSFHTSNSSLSAFLSSFQRSTVQPSIMASVTPSSVFPSLSYPITTSTTITSARFPTPSYHFPLSSFSDVTIIPSSIFLSSSYHILKSSSNVVTTTSSVKSSSYRTTFNYPPLSVVTITPSILLSSSHHKPTPSIVATISSSNVQSSHQDSSTSSIAVAGTLLSDFLSSSQRSPSFPSALVSTTPSIVFRPPSYSSLLDVTTLSSIFLSSYHASINLSTPITTSTLSDFLLSSYNKPTSLLSIDTTNTSSVIILSPQTSHAPSSVVVSTIPLTAATINPSSTFQSSYHTSPSLSTVVTVITSPVFVPPSYHTSSSSTVLASITHLSSSYQTTTSSVVPTTSLSLFLPSSQRSPIPSIVVRTTSSSYHASTSSMNEIFSASLISSYHTISPQFPRTVTTPVSSQLSISSDLSTMVYPTTQSPIFYTLSKLSSTDTPWLPQPSYTSRDSILTATILSSSPSVKTLVLTSTKPSSRVTLPTDPTKQSPKIYNNFDVLRVTVGKVFNVLIPADTFHDREDGNTRDLRLDCLTVKHGKLSSDSWLQFNSTTQTLFGLVLRSQLAGIGTEYFLTASDHDGNTVYDAFTVHIEDKEQQLAAMFSVKLARTSLEIFSSNLGNILSVVQTIAGYYGDKDESLIQVLSLTEGSVIFAWSNTSLKTCNEDLISELARKVMTRQHDIEPDFQNALSPRFIAEDVYVNNTGPCVLYTTANPSVSELSSHDTSMWLKYVLPALAIAVVVVVVAVACFLVRRHSGAKVLKEDKHTFKRRKPIILDGELEMSTLSGKPIELPEDSLTPVRFPPETSLATPDYDEDDIPEWPSPILPAPSYQRLPPQYSDGGTNRYNTPPPPYKLPPSY